MTTKTRSTARGGERLASGYCWWCHVPLQMDAPYRGTDPSITTPGVGVFVCTPACPERPKTPDIKVWKRERRAG